MRVRLSTKVVDSDRRRLLNASAIGIAAAEAATIAAALAVLGGSAIPLRTSTPCKCRAGSRSPSSGDTKAGRPSPSVKPERWP